MVFDDLVWEDRQKKTPKNKLREVMKQGCEEGKKPRFYPGALCIDGILYTTGTKSAIVVC